MCARNFGFLCVMADDAAALHLLWLWASLANGLIAPEEFGNGLLAPSATSHSNAAAAPSQRVASERRTAPLEPAATPQVSLAPLRLDCKTKRKSPPQF